MAGWGTRGAPPCGRRRRIGSAVRRAAALGLLYTTALSGTAVVTVSELRIATRTERVRQDVKDLTGEEGRTFIDAVLALKSAPSPYDRRYGYYDQFVVWHKWLAQCDPGDPLVDRRMTGHAGPMFLPWHRQLLLMFEDALRNVTGKPVTIPYWDWTDPHSTSAVFALMGGDGDPQQDYAVTSGPFRKGSWELTVHPDGLEWSGSGTPYLTRRIDSFPGISLPTTAQLEHLFTAPRYDVAPFDDRSEPDRSFRNALEGWPQRLQTGELLCPPDGWVAAFPVLTDHQMHNAVHLWAGGNTASTPGGIRLGTMAIVPTSPNDPVFWLNHANVDRLWAQWQERYGIDTYQPRTGVTHNSAGDVIRPFDEYGLVVTPNDVANIAALGYRYAGRNGAGSAVDASANRAATSADTTAAGQPLSCSISVRPMGPPAAVTS